MGLPLRVKIFEQPVKCGHELRRHLAKLVRDVDGVSWIVITVGIFDGALVSSFHVPAKGFEPPSPEGDAVTAR